MLNEYSYDSMLQNIFSEEKEIGKRLYKLGSTGSSDMGGVDAST